MLFNPCEMGFIVSVLYIKELRNREVQQLAQDHTANKWQANDYNPGESDSKARYLPPLLLHLLHQEFCWTIAAGPSMNTCPMRTGVYIPQRAHSLRLYDPHCGGANPPLHLSLWLSTHLPILLTFPFTQLSLSFPSNLSP